jgi:hypothetical protein
VAAGNESPTPKSKSWIIEIVQLSPRYILPIFIFTGIVVLLGYTNMLGIFGLNPLYDKYRAYVGVVFLASGCFLFSHGLWKVYVGIKEWNNRRNLHSVSKDRLRRLTNPEKKLLRRFIIDRETSIHASITDGTIAEFVHYKIIYRSTNVGHAHAFAYNMQPWARKFLEKNAKLLELEKEEEENKDSVVKRRY